MTGDERRPVVIAYDGSAHATQAIAAAAELFAGRPARVLTAWGSVRGMARVSSAIAHHMTCPVLVVPLPPTDDEGDHVGG